MLTASDTHNFKIELTTHPISPLINLILFHKIHDTEAQTDPYSLKNDP